jgi:hypothetical protein
LNGWGERSRLAVTMTFEPAGIRLGSEENFVAPARVSIQSFVRRDEPLDFARLRLLAGTTNRSTKSPASAGPRRPLRHKIRLLPVEIEWMTSRITIF